MVTKLTDMINKSGFYTGIYPLVVPVLVVDVREVFGRVDYKIVPEGGQGTKWISSDSFLHLK